MKKHVAPKDHMSFDCIKINFLTEKDLLLESKL